MNIVKLQDIKSIHRNPLHWYTLTMKKTEREIKETVPFTTATKRVQHLGVNLPKETKDPCIGNCKTLMKQIKDDTNRWKIIPCLWIIRINVLKMSILKRWECQTIWPVCWETCRQVRKQQLELDMEQQTGSKQGKEYVKAVFCHPAYLTYMQSTS